MMDARRFFAPLVACALVVLLAQTEGCSSDMGVACGKGTCSSGQTCCDNTQCLDSGVQCCNRGNDTVCPSAGYECCAITASNPTGCCAVAGGSGGGGGGGCPSGDVPCGNTCMPQGASCCPDGLHNCPAPYTCNSSNQCVGGGGSGGGGSSGGCTAQVCCGGLYECNGRCYSTCTPGSQPCCTDTECVCYTPCC